MTCLSCETSIYFNLQSYALQYAVFINVSVSIIAAARQNSVLQISEGKRSLTNRFFINLDGLVTVA